jgi:CRP-like cAMP-binding protein
MNKHRYLWLLKKKNNILYLRRGKMFTEHINILLKSILFKGISRDEINSMIHCLNPKVCHYKKGEHVVIAGDNYTGVGIVVKGSVCIAKEKASGSRIIMKILKAGDMFGEVIAFSSEMQWPVTIQAQEDSTVFFFREEKITGSCQKVCPWHKIIIENMLSIISERAMMLNKKVEYLTIKSIRGKVSSFLIEQYNKYGSKTFMIPMKRNEMAEFLNVSRPSMSREMCRMRDEGVIEFHLSSFKILDVDALKHMAES